MSKKPWFIAYSGENIALNKKLFPTEVWPTNYTGYIKVSVYLKIKPRKR